MFIVGLAKKKTKLPATFQSVNKLMKNSLNNFLKNCRFFGLTEIFAIALSAHSFAVAKSTD